MSVQRRELRKKAIGGSYTIAEWQDLLKQFNHRCASCHKRRRLTADHIVPISLWGIFFKEFIDLGIMKYECNDIDNIQPLCGPCNSKKRNKFTTGDTFTDLPL